MAERDATPAAYTKQGSNEIQNHPLNPVLTGFFVYTPSCSVLPNAPTCEGFRHMVDHQLDGQLHIFCIQLRLLGRHEIY